MNTQQQPVEPKAAAPLDTVLLLLAVTAVAGGIAAFYALAGQLNVTLRVVMVLASLGVAAGLAYQTATGKNMWGYIRGSQLELRKTTWPTRQESLQATLMIAAVVLIFALMVWLLDSGLLWAVKHVTERG
ncbi:MAG: preprotein translocase subunit SecE [Nevskiaceae bacterium]